MKILNKEQIYEADKVTIEKEGIPSYNLMERAGGYAYRWIHQQLGGRVASIKIFCGIGNNGGDGLVIARYLIENGYNVNTYIVNYSEHRSPDFLTAYDTLKEKTKTWPETIKSFEELPELTPNDLIIDCMFGIGYSRPAAAWVQDIFKAINMCGAYILSIDMPSGMYMDKIPADDEVFIIPQTVLTFQVPKLVFFLPQTGQFIENWELVDIGLDREYLQKVETDIQLITRSVAQQIYRPRGKFIHKGMCGHALIIGGSQGKMGASVLASKACLKAGAGMVTAYVPECGEEILQIAVPEAMTISSETNYDILEVIDYDLEPDVIGIGIGMGTDEKTAKSFGAFLAKAKKPLVIDADALNILAKNPDFLLSLPNQSILTPHPKELERLIGNWSDDFEKLKLAKKFAKYNDIILVIKGAHSITIYDNQLYINTTGNAGMATAGSGDTLTGIITGILAQGYDPLDAALFGVYIHGSAGDVAAAAMGFEAVTAGEIINHIGPGILAVFQDPTPVP